MYIGKDELTLTTEQIEQLRDQIVSDWRDDLLFQSKANRDAVAKACVAAGTKVKRSSDGPHQLDPRYTAEGQHLPDRGLANDYRHMFYTLYHLTTV